MNTDSLIGPSNMSIASLVKRRVVSYQLITSCKSPIYAQLNVPFTNSFTIRVFYICNVSVCKWKL